MPIKWFIALLSHGYINNDLRTMIHVAKVCSEDKKTQQKYSKLVVGDQSSPTLGMGTPPKGYTFANWIP